MVYALAAVLLLVWAAAVPVISCVFPVAVPGEIESFMLPAMLIVVTTATAPVLVLTCVVALKSPENSPVVGFTSPVIVPA